MTILRSYRFVVEVTLKLPNGKNIVVQESQYHGLLKPCKYL